MLKPGLVDLEQVSSLAAQFGLLSLVLLPDTLQQEKKGGRSRESELGAQRMDQTPFRTPLSAYCYLVNTRRKKKNREKCLSALTTPQARPGEEIAKVQMGVFNPAPPRLAGLGRLRSAGNAQEPAEQRERELGRGRR